MIDTIYVEEAIGEHPRVAEVTARFPKARLVPISRYGEVFNRNHQSFRLQKRKPSLVLARKHENHVLRAPYGIGGDANFYFSHVLNCLYDCRYCFLQGMYRSAHYVVFVNYEDFQDAIAASSPGTFFSGYDGDSLVLEPITGFLESFLPFFAVHPRAILELRTKSVAVRPLLVREAFENAVVAFSFTPEAHREAFEHGVPPVSERIRAMTRVAERGWKLGLRFDPLLYDSKYRERYRELFRQVFDRVSAGALHSVSLGAFRLPRDYFRRMAKLYPDERLFALPLEERSGMVSYPRVLEEEMRGFCTEEILTHVPREILFPCQVEVAS